MNISFALNQLGITQDELGYKYITEMAKMLIKFNTFDYKAAAKQCKVSEKFFRKEINSSIECALSRGKFHRVNKLFNYEIYKEGIILTSSEFIFFLCKHIDSYDGIE